MLNFSNSFNSLSLITCQVRIARLSLEAQFPSHLSVMADSGIVVALHNPLLANAIFLAPGSLVLELLPYKWEWKGISQLYYNLTRSTGSIHHVAWRPTDPKWCAYKEPSESRWVTCLLLDNSTALWTLFLSCLSVHVCSDQANVISPAVYIDLIAYRCVKCYLQLTINECVQLCH